MSEAITDTGPILHLHEIDQFACLTVFGQLTLPQLVAEELQRYSIEPSLFQTYGLRITVVEVDYTEWTSVSHEMNQTPIQPADAQVFALARSVQFRQIVLTDDLALRRRLESQRATVVGSVGVLVRAYAMGLLKRSDLEKATDALFTSSTLYVSRAFRAYVSQLIASLP